MSAAERVVCALPGCSHEVEQVPSGEPRRYCCTAHRKIARKQRRDRRAVSTAVWPLVSSTRPHTAVEAGVAAASGGEARDEPTAAAATPQRFVGAHIDSPPPPVVADQRPAPEGTEPQYRRLVPEPRPRWFRSTRSHAARGLGRNRPRRTLPPLPSHPEWLWPTSPGKRRAIIHDPLPPPPPRPKPAQPASFQPPSTPPTPAPRSAPPSPPARLAPPAAPAPPAARPSPMSPGAAPQPATAPAGSTPRRRGRGALAALRDSDRFPGLHGKLTELHEAKQRRKAVREVERREAAAVLAGLPLPGEPVKESKGRRKRLAALVEYRAGPTEKGAVVGQMRETLAAALHSVSSNRLRSLLTTVGIVVGVAAVILLVGMGNGMKVKFDAEFGKLANQITITPVKGSVAAGRVGRDITDRDVEALSDPQNAPHIASISPAIVGNVQLAAEQNKDQATLVGAVGNYLELLNRHMAAGRWFSEGELNGGTKVTVLGEEALNLLYGPETDPNSVIGLKIRIGTSTFEIRGVVASDGQNDNTAIVPFDAARSYLVGGHGGKIDMIIIKSTSVATLDHALGEVIDVMDRQHSIREPTNRDYKAQTFTELLRQNSKYINFLTMFIVAVAAISLFVGGIGVANIMLVAVTERTREIGIRKAIGAKTAAILRQFLSEAVMLTGLGGLIGVVFGVGATILAAEVVPDIDKEIPVPILTATPVVVAFTVSLIIGVLAGSYPAHRAARLRPIEALRFE